LYRVRNRQVAIVKDRQAISEDCGEASLVISLVAAGRRCRAPVVVDWFDLRREGAHAFYIGAAGIEFDTVRRWRGARPWAGYNGAEN
jgi:competence protein ComEC